MEQISVASATPARRGLPALRPLLLLGGFMLAWWLLMTGAAQADDGHSSPSRDLGTAVKAVTGKVSAPAQSAPAAKPQPRERSVQKSVRAVVEPVVTPVRSTVRTTVRTVVKTVEATPAKPVVRTVDAVVRETRKQLRPTTDAVRAEVGSLLVRTTGMPLDLPRSPALDATVSIVDPGNPVSDTASDNAATRGADTVESSSATSASAAVPAELAALVEQTGVSDTSDRAAVAQSSSNHPLDELPGSGVLTATGSSSAGSAGPGPGHAPCAALLGSGLHLNAPGADSVRPTDSDRRPVGPAYPPSCSPD